MTLKVRRVLDPIVNARFSLGGEIGTRLGLVTDQWILPAPLANPAMIEMFRNRDRKPYQDQVPWAGEFAGKYLTHAVQIYRLTRDADLASHIAWFVEELASVQAADGYLGPWPKEWRLRKGAPNCAEPWDAWGHYHIMMGLLLWYQTLATDTARGLRSTELTASARTAQKTARRIADLFCSRFLGSAERLHDTGAHEMNQAPIHSFCLLYEITGEQRYLDMAHQIEKEFEIPPAGDYIRTALAGLEFHQTPKPRWESLHPIMGIASLYHITGDEKYRRAFEHIWWSIVKGDRHNNGGFSSGERATGDPYHKGAIETCCTVAWMAMSVEMLRMTGDSVVADEIELSLFNSGIGMMSPSGRWVTYDTPMDGQRLASAHHIVFQARAGSPELNCCSVNGPRALGLISDWAIMRGEEAADGVPTLCLNYYGPGRMAVPLPSGSMLTLVQRTAYPLEGRVDLAIKLRKPERFALCLRIPYWSKRTAVSLNGRTVGNVKSGRYLRLERTWRPGDRIRLELDFRLHFWAWGEFELLQDWVTEWRVFGPAPQARPDDARLTRDIAAADRLTSMPTSLRLGGKVYEAATLRSEGGILDFRESFPKLSGFPFVYCFTEIESPRQQKLTVGFGADWWSAWFVNGVKVFDNHTTGGNSGPVSERTNRVELPLRKGRNLVALRITSGTAGFWASLGRKLPGGTSSSRSRAYRTSIYRGPILLAYDPRFAPEVQQPETENVPSGLAAQSAHSPALPVPILAAHTLAGRRVEAGSWLEPWLLLEFSDAEGRPVRLCDFGSAGAAGNRYLSWLPVRFGFEPKAVFSRSNPLRSFRVSGRS